MSFWTIFWLVLVGGLIALLNRRIKKRIPSKPKPVEIEINIKTESYEHLRTYYEVKVPVPKVGMLRKWIIYETYYRTFYGQEAILDKFGDYHFTFYLRCLTPRADPIKLSIRDFNMNNQEMTTGKRFYSAERYGPMKHIEQGDVTRITFGLYIRNIRKIIIDLAVDPNRKAYEALDELSRAGFKPGGLSLSAAELREILWEY